MGSPHQLTFDKHDFVKAFLDPFEKNNHLGD